MNPQITFVVPPKLESYLGSSELAEAVRLSLARFGGWLGSGQGLFFFPEYTNHDPVHVNRVLASATALISESSWETGESV